MVFGLVWFGLVCGLLAVAGFRPGGRPTFFLTRQKESRQRKRRFLFVPIASDTRPAGHLRHWGESVLLLTRPPVPARACPRSGNTAHGIGCFSPASYGLESPHGRKWPAGARVRSGLAKFEGLFLCLLSFWPPKKKVGRPPGRDPAMQANHENQTTTKRWPS